MEIYLIRHTAPDVPPGTCYGQSDVALADSFADECATLRAKLPEGWDHLYTSPLSRCYQLAERWEPSPTVDIRLQELHFGTWEGRSWNDVPREETQPWMDNFVNVACPDGESYRMLSERVIAFWLELLTKPHKTVLVVAHAGPIRAILAETLGLPLQQSFRLAVDYGSVSLVRVQNQYATIQFINK